MKPISKKSRLILYLLMVVLLVIGVLTGVKVYNKRKTSSNIVISPKALMAVTSGGGNCPQECKHSIYNLYENGVFERHKSLSDSEVIKLKNLINGTDFLKYGPKPQPFCQSFVDGTDLVLIFPQKYGNKEFVPCMLNIPDQDPTLSFINQIIDSH